MRRWWRLFVVVVVVVNLRARRVGRVAVCDLLLFVRLLRLLFAVLELAEFLRWWVSFLSLRKHVLSASTRFINVSKASSWPVN